MKRRDIIICTLIFFLVALFAVDTASVGLRGQHIVSLPKLWLHKAKTYTVSSRCDARDPVRGLEKASAPELRTLPAFQTACSSYAASAMMTFTDMPKDALEAKQMAADMAVRLKEFKHYGVMPLVVMEPVASWGSVDFTEFRDGLYDPWITAYFTNLKANGVTDEQMGMWVAFPEANLPYWNHHNSTPADFAANINRFVNIQKTYFPKSKASVMLNSATYTNDDFDWAKGEYVSLVPYVKGISRGLIDSFGLQGFPWTPRAKKPGAGIFDASEYLNATLAKEAADQLGVKQIWLNTGSFGRKYTLDEHDTVTLTPEKRQAILGGIVDEALKLKGQGYQVSINLFSQDKSAVDEATNWSYWKKDQPLNSPDAIVFHDFAKRLYDEEIGLWLFDR
ncbi:MAG: hypothetical protein JWN01_442 [Patescibacteria group bacterium]|nr:hypothetical protein [Patescibacteria group bacterium]